MTELLGSKFYDEDYFDNTESEKCFYKDSNGYNEHSYSVLKNHQAIQILRLLGYTSKWKPNDVLVVGCAKGFLVRAMMMVGVNAEGIDVSEYAIEESKKYTTNCHVNNICNIPEYKDEEFELVIAMEVLENIPNEFPDDDNDKTYLQMALDEICRVAQRYVVISTLIGDDDKYHDKSKDENYYMTNFSVYPPEWWELEFSKRNFIKIMSKVVDDKLFLMLRRI